MNHLKPSILKAQNWCLMRIGQSSGPSGLARCGQGNNVENGEIKRTMFPRSANPLQRQRVQKCLKGQFMIPQREMEKEGLRGTPSPTYAL